MTLQPAEETPFHSVHPTLISVQAEAAHLLQCYNGSVRFKFDSRNSIEIGLTVVLGIFLQTAIVLSFVPISPVQTFLNLAYNVMTSRRRLWSIANNSERSVHFWSSFKRSLSAVCFGFLRFLRLEPPLTYFWQIYEQFQGKTAQLAVANVM